ncbi:MAG TPA: hypothetical protein H9881_02720 [Candidatus Stackebrandtia excrementipullorum]|nr:hypothetical protein [Candidatus Stackebrandtia excrementipullorum]
MSTFTKIKNYRQRRAELTAHRIVARRSFESPHETARREMLLYGNRVM